jgi:hypothetical protein
VRGERADTKVAHLKAWQWAPLPVILILYDATGDGQAFWLYVQNYISNRANVIDADYELDTVTLHVPTENRLDAVAIERFRGFRDKVLAQMKGLIGHDG